MGLRKRFLVVVVGVPGSPAEAQRSEVGRFRSMGTAEQAGQDEWRRILFVHAPHVDRYRIVIEDDGVEVGEVPMPELPAEAGPGLLDETVTPLGASSVGALGEPIEEQVELEVEVEAEVEPEPEPEPEPAPEAPVVTEAVGAVAVVAAVEHEEPEEPAPVESVESVEVVEVVEVVEAIEATGELEVIVDEDDLAATGEHKGLADEVAADDVSATGEVPVITPEHDGAPAPPAPRPYIEIEDPPDGPVPEDVIARFAAMVEADREREARRADRERGDAG